MDTTKTDSPTFDVVSVWQCIGGGRIESPQPCIGVCGDRQVRFVTVADHEQALDRLNGAQQKAAALERLLVRLTRTSPRDGGWERCYTTYQAQVRRLISEWSLSHEAPRGVRREPDEAEP
jgi:hypothetical protein